MGKCREVIPACGVAAARGNGERVLDAVVADGSVSSEGGDQRVITALCFRSQSRLASDARGLRGPVHERRARLCQPRSPRSSACRMMPDAGDTPTVTTSAGILNPSFSSRVATSRKYSAASFWPASRASCVFAMA